MNIIFAIDQAAALKLGINAPNSTQGVDIDPAVLTQDERDMLASKITDGHKALGISIRRPDVQGVRERLAELVASKQKHEAWQKEEEAKAKQRATEYLQTILSNNETESRLVYLNEAGNPVGNYGVVHTIIDLPKEIQSQGWYYRDLTTEQKQQHDVFVQARNAEREKLIKAAADELRDGPYQDWLARRAAEKADYQSLYARLPETLRRRDEAGFADEQEVLKAIRALIREDAGLSEYGTWRWYLSSKPDSLTDSEFEALESFKALLPAGAEVEVKEVTDKGEALSDEWGEPELDSDGDPAYEAINRRIVAIAKWQRAGVTVKAVCTLGQRSDNDA